MLFDEQYKKAPYYVMFYLRLALKYLVGSEKAKIKMKRSTQVNFAEVAADHSISVIVTAEIIHHRQVAPMTKGSKKVR